MVSNIGRCLAGAEQLVEDIHLHNHRAAAALDDHTGAVKVGTLKLLKAIRNPSELL